MEGIVLRHSKWYPLGKTDDSPRSMSLGGGSDGEEEPPGSWNRKEVSESTRLAMFLKAKRNTPEGTRGTLGHIGSPVSYLQFSSSSWLNVRIVRLVFNRTSFVTDRSKANRKFTAASLYVRKDRIALNNVWDTFKYEVICDSSIPASSLTLRHLLWALRTPITLSHYFRYIMKTLNDQFLGPLKLHLYLSLYCVIFMMIKGRFT